MNAEGRQVLAEIHKQSGVSFIAGTPLSKYLAEEARHEIRKTPRKNGNMRGPYGLEMSENCQTCKLRKSAFFRQLTPKALRDFNSVRASYAYPEGAVLFLEKQNARGVFILCDGKVKLTISSSNGKTLILRIAKSGEALGLMASLSGQPYEVTAETLCPCRIAFVRRDDFLRFMAQHPEASPAIVSQLSSNYHGACEQLRMVGLSASAQGKLAKALLDWTAGAEQTKLGTQIQLPLTHKEIAEFIGSSRETVARTFSEFRSRRLVTLKGSTLMISDRAALETFVTV
jgi:CRP/FNR family transcriptional regulator